MARLPIVSACDQAFLPGLRALLKSIRVHSPGRPVHVLDCGILHRDRQRVSHEFPEVEFVKFTALAGLPVPSVGSHATYARLFIGALFSGAGRLLYLDSDTVVVNQLDALDDVYLNDEEIIAACVEPYTPTFGAENGVADYKALGLTACLPYFNAGVMLVDVPRWNRAGVMDATLTYLRRTDLRITLYDQEALNVCLASRWRQLAPEWNVSRYWMREERRSRRPAILDEARIVHFLSAEKPWSHPADVHPWMLSAYQRYAE